MIPGKSLLARAIVAFSLCCIKALHVDAQSPSPDLQFETATVKPNTNGGPRVYIGTKSPGTFSAENATLESLIQQAWGVTIERPWLPFRIAPQAGVPIIGSDRWLATDRFDVTAKWTPSGEAKEEQARERLMLRSLLAERFHVRLHIQKKDLPVYQLRIMRGTLKLHAAHCLAFGVAEPPTPPGAPLPDYCGASRIGREGLDWTLNGTAMKMGELAGTLSLLLGRPVTDNTGFAGTFDVHMQWTPGSGEKGDLDLPPQADGPGPSIFTELSEKLGLKLDPAKASIEVLVVDYAAKPSAN